MIEKTYNFIQADEKTIERIVDDENINLNHMIFKEGDALPEHYSNSNLYMIIIKGTMSIKLDDQDFNEYKVGDILNIPYNIKMNVINKNKEILEFFVIKSPHPNTYKKD